MTSAWLHSSPVEPNTSAAKHTVFMFTIKTVVFSLLFHTSPIFRVTLLCTNKLWKTRRETLPSLSLRLLYNFYPLYNISYESLMICVAPWFFWVKVQFPTSGKWRNVNNWCASLVWGQEWNGARSWLSLKVYDPAGNEGDLAVKASLRGGGNPFLLWNRLLKLSCMKLKQFVLIMQTPNTKTSVNDFKDIIRIEVSRNDSTFICIYLHHPKCFQQCV